MIENSGPRLIRGAGDQDTIDLDAAEECTLAYPCGGWEYAAFQADKVGDGTWGTAVLTVQESIDGVEFHNTTVTIPAGGGFGSAVLSIRAPYCRLKVTTDNAAAARAKCHIYLWNSTIRKE